MISVCTWLLAAYIFCVTPTSVTAQSDTNNNLPTGTWIGKSGDTSYLLLLQNGYLAFTKYDFENKKFYYTKGGPYSFANSTISLKYEFHSDDKTQVAEQVQLAFIREGNNIKIREGDKWLSLQLSDSSVTSLAGCWRINGRMQNGSMSQMHLKPRRTLKMLTGTHFQWMAINTATGEFFGSGGGRYEFKNGRYTEYIEFFSRDGTRVGASLSFDGAIKNGLWHHAGQSSKGEPIHETWVQYP